MEESEWRRCLAGSIFSEPLDLVVARQEPGSSCSFNRQSVQSPARYRRSAHALTPSQGSDHPKIVSDVRMLYA